MSCTCEHFKQRISTWGECLLWQQRSQQGWISRRVTRILTEVIFSLYLGLFKLHPRYLAPFVALLYQKEGSAQGPQDVLEFRVGGWGSCTCSAWRREGSSMTQELPLGAHQEGIRNEPISSQRCMVAGKETAPTAKLQWVVIRKSFPHESSSALEQFVWRVCTAFPLVLW